MAIAASMSISQGTQSASANTTSVTATIKVSWSFGSWDHNNKTSSITIDGTTYTFTTPNINPNKTSTGSQTLYSKSKTVTHHSTNGSKTVSVSCSVVTASSSGTVTASTSKKLSALPAGYCTLSLALSESERTPSTNTSKVTAVLTAKSDAYFWGTMSSCYVKVDGTTSNLANKYIAKSSTVEVGRYTKTITHPSSGSVSVACSGNTASGTLHDPALVSKSITLSEIPRGSILSAVSNFNFEDGVLIKYTEYIAGSDLLTIKIGNTAIRSSYQPNDSTNSETIKFTDIELLNIYRTLGTAKTGTVTFSLQTYSGSTQIGATSTKTATGTKKGNRYRKIGETWKSGIGFRKINGVWKSGIRFRKINGIWKS